MNTDSLPCKCPSESWKVSLLVQQQGLETWWHEWTAAILCVINNRTFSSTDSLESLMCKRPIPLGSNVDCSSRFLIHQQSHYVYMAEILGIFHLK